MFLLMGLDLLTGSLCALLGKAAQGERFCSRVMFSGLSRKVMMLALVFDPRYSSFPSAALVLPALVYLVRPVTGPRREIALLTFIIGAGIAPQLFREGLLNQQAWGWAVVSGLMVAALWRCLRVRRG